MEFTKENILGVFGDFRRGQLSFDNLEKEIVDLDDTPEKVVVPEFVADWIELCKEKANLIDCLQGGYRHFNGCEHIGEDEDWLFEGDNQDVVARAWLYGYEVEKEPLYHVATKDGKLMLFKYKNVVSVTPAPVDMTIKDYGHKPFYQLTEAEIKNHDERYWAFAVRAND